MGVRGLETLRQFQINFFGFSALVIGDSPGENRTSFTRNGYLHSVSTRHGRGTVTHVFPAEFRLSSMGVVFDLGWDPRE